MSAIFFVPRCVNGSKQNSIFTNKQYMFEFIPAFPIFMVIEIQVYGL